MPSTTQRLPASGVRIPVTVSYPTVDVAHRGTRHRSAPLPPLALDQSLAGSPLAGRRGREAAGAQRGGIVERVSAREIAYSHAAHLTGNGRWVADVLEELRAHGDRRIAAAL